MANIPQHTLPALGEKLSKDGPQRIERTPRRLRGLHSGKWLFDTTKAIYVWEHPYYPYFYIPRAALASGVVLEKIDPATQKDYWVARLSIDGKVITEDVLVFETLGELKNVSRQNVFLYETGLRPRFYLAPTFVNWEYLTESDTISYCPYKGMANYYNIVVGKKEIKDAVWYYKYPTHESQMIAGHLCFYNEKVNVFIEGVQEAHNPNGTPLPGET
ncbi:hypothetical protein DH86_00001860 [Scytalidium sp. 3C]|nr:hypothetical protein DH86_00001860 [Scytalidium sp. 3C]